MSIKRPSKGQTTAGLGDLYDARTDCFLKQCSILNTSAVKCVNIPTTDYEFPVTGTYRELFFKLHLSAELGASVLSGLVDVGSNAHFLTETLTSSRMRQVSCLYKTTTVHERLNLAALSSEVESNFNVDILRAGKGTHVATDIEWGTSSIVTARYERADSDSTADIQGRVRICLEQLIEQLVGVGAGAGGAVTNGRRQRDTQAAFTVRIQGDFVTDSDIPTDFESVDKFISRIPRSVAASNNGKGKPLTYTLVPLEMLCMMFDLQITQQVILRRLDSEILEQVVQLFDECSEAVRKLHNYNGDTKTHQFCLSTSHVQEAAEHLKQARTSMLRLRSSYAKVLTDVRSGAADKKHLWNLLEESRNADRPAVDAFIREAAMRSGSAYILFLNDASCMEDGKRWEENRNLILELLKSPDMQNQVMVCDYYEDTNSPHDTNLVQLPYVAEYRAGRVVTQDLNEGQKFLAGKCVICHGPNPLIRSGFDRPVQSRLMKMVCAGKGCRSGSAQIWICATCKEAVQFGHVDEFLYCKCGRAWYKNCAFKCFGNSHGVSYETPDPDTLLKQLQSLDAMNDINVLILGETGVDKSTFINAFVNYLTYETLNDAMRAPQPEYLVPFSFSYQCRTRDGNGFTTQEIRAGSSPNEHNGIKGGSATKTPTFIESHYMTGRCSV
ncbi:hypothetical protein QBC38DRAFT_518174 [Podospora fimiseda]|uniref:G domain-containing protein n=1 Tax=Podospora fimiseda TaxID=252190 RepID=A0AAN6YQ34_9PEZI|nr:hypothetical protein QBC38DRAFT_518174 [Podospora fimiseda]